MKRLVILASLLLASGAALATNGEDEGNGGNGRGGNGRGGNSSSSATGGSVKNSGNSNNRNSNRNTNQQTQDQIAEARATAAATAGATSAATAANNGNGSNNTNINTPKQPVSTAYATSLTSGFDTCLGSVAGGVQSSVLGLSAGGTKVDKNCILIKQVQLLTQMGYKEAACYRARAGEEGMAIDAALTAAGVDCKPVPVAPAIPAIGSAEVATTRGELDEAFKKAVQK